MDIFYNFVCKLNQLLINKKYRKTIIINMLLVQFSLWYSVVLCVSPCYKKRTYTESHGVPIAIGNTEGHRGSVKLICLKNTYDAFP